MLWKSQKILPFSGGSVPWDSVAMQGSGDRPWDNQKTE